MATKKLDAKNLEVLSELMLVEELAHKKSDAYSKMFKDEQLQKQCKYLAAQHKARFDALYDYVKTIEKSAGNDEANSGGEDV